MVMLGSKAPAIVQDEDKGVPMILSCQNISKAFGTECIVTQASFHIEDHEKAAIVGINGAGKINAAADYRRRACSRTAASWHSQRARHSAILSSIRTSTVIRRSTEELLSVKEDVLRMEQRMREMEHEMKHLSGDALQNLMEQYNRISTEFEHQNGYALQSELVGVLKGLGFTEDEFQTENRDLIRRSEDTRRARTSAALLPGSFAARRADQPSGL